MPTSDEGLAKRVFRRLVQALACIAALAIANVGLTLALEPYGTFTEVIWSSYNQAADEEIDTILLGTSVAKIGLNPLALRETLDCSPWNVSTDSQSFDNSLRALKTAHEDHGIRRAIIGIGYSTLEQKPFVESASTFSQAIASTKPPLGKVLSYVEGMVAEPFFSSRDSIAMLFPWTFSHVDFNLEQIAGNLRNRVECATPLEAAQRRFPHWTYLDRGYYYTSYEIDLETAGNDVPPRLADDGPTPYEPNLVALERIARYCEENEIELYVVVTPKPAFSTLCLGDAYPSDMQDARERVERLGGTFLDFNVAQEGFYSPAYDEFNDYEHLNYPGAARFSQTLGQLISRIEAGEDVSDEFFGYDEWDAWKRSLDHISVIGAKGTPTGAGISVDVWAWADPEIDIEYQLSRLDDEGNAIEVVIPWSGETSFELPADGHGTYHLRVDARRADKPDEIERTSLLDVLY